MSAARKVTQPDHGAQSMPQNTPQDNTLQSTEQSTAQSERLFTLSNPKFIAVKGNFGQVFKTNTFVQKENAINTYGAAHLKFGLSSNGTSWKDRAYGLPYFGVGIYTARFKGRSHDLGKPFSVYVFHGATLANLSEHLKFNYEWNLGASFGWDAYDPVDNPENVAIGSEVNVHVGLNFYLKYMTRSGLDLHLGVEASHFSNGATRMPNKGLNIGSVYLEMAYNFGRDGRFIDPYRCPLPPAYEPHYLSDLMVNFSSRQKYSDTKDMGASDIVLNHKFRVLGATYSFMRAPNYRYRYGLSADFVYDESSGVRDYLEINPHDGKEYQRYHKGNVEDRFSLGLSIKGEVVLPGYSIFANFGRNMIHGNKEDNRLYQIVGVKVYLKENFFATFGIRASNFSSAQFLYWNLGYTIKHNKMKIFGW